mmetsp:Transcript_1254/g.3901  ORF Transcript_1254/g.3901 Transcript_1254/m.3901 type:complete len:250 (+) Transcript_1254:102-851(+)
MPRSEATLSAADKLQRPEATLSAAQTPQTRKPRKAQEFVRRGASAQSLKGARGRRCDCSKGASTWRGRKVALGRSLGDHAPARGAPKRAKPSQTRLAPKGPSMQAVPSRVSTKVGPRTESASNKRRLDGKKGGSEAAGRNRSDTLRQCRAQKSRQKRGRRFSTRRPVAGSNRAERRFLKSGREHAQGRTGPFLAVFKGRPLRNRPRRQGVVDGPLKDRSRTTALDFFKKRQSRGYSTFFRAVLKERPVV